MNLIKKAIQVPLSGIINHYSVESLIRADVAEAIPYLILV